MIILFVRVKKTLRDIIFATPNTYRFLKYKSNEKKKKIHVIELKLKMFIIDHVQNLRTYGCVMSREDFLRDILFGFLLR